MRLEIDHDADMTYIYLSDNEVGESIGYGEVVIDLDRDGNACGIEIFGSDVSVLELGKN